MSKRLIIVESPTKIKTLQKFLGKDYIFESSVGHIRDLPAKKFGIDLENNFEPQYELLETKKEVIERIKAAAKKVDIVYLSPDPDREGEAIAWHIASILPKGTKYKRVTFNAITKEAVEEALKHPRSIDAHLVDAQQARRLLDRMVGYKISPILHRKIHRGSRDGSLSAGRVQSVALKFVVDREREIEAFTSVEYWLLGAHLSKEKKDKSFIANLHSVNGLRVEKEASDKKEVFLISNEKTAHEVEQRLKKASYRVSSVEKKEKKRNPVAPFITSTLQQEASRHYGFQAARTMSVAQSLYEGVEIGSKGSEGLITYMRTDSTRIAPEVITEARALLSKLYGPEYIPQEPNSYSTKKGSQDAHEAIRPANLTLNPDEIRKFLSPDQYKLYHLIWQRFFASQMKPAIYDTVACDIDTDQNIQLRATGSIVKFKGFLIVYEEKEDTEEHVKELEGEVLPELKEGAILYFHESFANQSFTKPPPRYTEASLIKELEKSGIGRPSTYTSIMQKIQGRSYTTKERNTLKPTELGVIICSMLERNFPKIMNAKFTAEMEDELDKIAETDANWKDFIKKFWDDFYPTVEIAEKEAHVPKIMTEKICPDCGHKLQKIWGNDRYFYGCSNYPDCKYTTPLEELTYNKEDYADNFDWDQKCPKCEENMKVRKSRFGIFLGCEKYPECKGIVNIPKKGELSAEDLPKCPAIGCDGQIVQRRSRFGKNFFSCSNYPDCDVIANSLEELETKYVDHPKTPYEKKTKRGAKKAAPEKKKAATKEKKTSTATKKKALTKEKKAPAEKKPRQSALYTPSKELANIIGTERTSRGDATKKLWDYIKKNDLQNPENKRQIVPDSKLTPFFGDKKPIDMMKLATHLSKHLKKD